jgi:hypothetical protein
MAIKRCGVLKNGVACDVLIPAQQSACPDCCEDLLRELERMADEPAYFPRGSLAWAAGVSRKWEL